jgi:hypothetical protein
MIINYDHKLAGHCESGATSGLLRHLGFQISEPMAFGIGSGLYFCYLPFIKAQDAPLFAFRSMPGKIFAKATKRLGAKMVLVKKYKDPDDAMKALDRNIELGIPSGVQVGTFHLKYYPPEYRLHYNFHNIVVFGRENGVYHISEPTRENTQLLAREDLQKARFAKGAFGPNGKMYYLLDKPEAPNLQKAIAEGVRENARKMVKDPFIFVGTRGMRKLSKDIKKWPEKYDEAKASLYLIQLVRSIEEYGTGGAAYRYVYGAFLKEAEPIMNNDIVTKASKAMGDTSNLWRDFSYRSARFIKNRAESHDSYSILSELLMECAEGEEKLFRGLLKLKI